MVPPTADHADQVQREVEVSNQRRCPFLKHDKNRIYDEPDKRVDRYMEGDEDMEEVREGPPQPIIADSASN